MHFQQKKDTQLHLRVASEDRELLEQLAKEHNTTVSEIIRTLIEEYRSQQSNSN